MSNSVWESVSVEQMQHRKSQLESIKQAAQLSLREAGEYDAISHGITAWREYRLRHNYRK